MPIPALDANLRIIAARLQYKLKNALLTVGKFSLVSLLVQFT